MPLRFSRRLRITVTALAGLALVVGLSVATLNGRSTPRANAAAPIKPFCNTNPQFCAETAQPWSLNGTYTGHDEPSVLYYSNVPGSGNSNLYQLSLPTDPPAPPNGNGTGGVTNFMLHPAFWFGMAMCDNQSAPNPGATCTPDSDTNIYKSTNPHSADYMGNTPGTAFMEMQFYPPGWGDVGAGVSCGPNNTQWCAALNIDSFSENSNTGVYNNNDCLNNAGVEYVNYAIITKSGVSQAPADPLRQTLATFSTGPDTLEMNSGDKLSVDMHDTPAGFQVIIHDWTTHQTGSMTASVANGFGHPLYQPTASTCTDQPYAFHPMYSTSTPDTRVLWAAHSYNVAYSDEIGHFEYCAAKATASTNAYRCHATSPSDPTANDSDDAPCWTLPLVNYSGTPNFGGCLGTDVDFDGPEYQHNWPGSNPSSAADALVHASPVVFSSPLFTGPGHSGLWNYQQVAFENDLPRIEGADISPNNDCQRHVYNPSDPSPGAGCVDPPNGASFYPIYSTISSGGACLWAEGDANIPGTTNNFGGTPTAEYGGLQEQIYPEAGYTTSGIYETFHKTLPNNPCPAPGGRGA
jgi:hypothetical protein